MLFEFTVDCGAQVTEAEFVGCHQYRSERGAGFESRALQPLFSAIRVVAHGQVVEY